MLTDLDFSRYREDWPDHFETARKRLEGLVPKACQIHHVGSTAVPGLSAKDCIDILIQVPCVEDLSEVVTVLQESGYDHRSESFAEDPRRSFLRLVRGDKRVEHVHVVTLGHPSGEEQLAMRDFLRAEPQARHAYCTLKSDLARKHPKDREAYINGKERLVRDLTAQASAWRQQSEGSPDRGLR